MVAAYSTSEDTASLTVGIRRFGRLSRASPSHTRARIRLSRSKKIELDSQRILAGFVGYGAGLAARLVVLDGLAQEEQQLGISEEQRGIPEQAIGDDGGGFFAWVFDDIQAYLADKKAMSFADLMRLKRERLRQAIEKQQTIMIQQRGGIQ